MKGILVLFGFILSVSVVFLIGICVKGCSFNAQAKSNSAGVETIHVTHDSFYVLDKRYDLCFYVHRRTTIIPIPCEVFNK